MPPLTKNDSSEAEPSIIEIIQNMVREGESEENILQTLNQLGVDPKKAQRLLLLAQADTFALLQSEISKIVRQDLEQEKKELTPFIQKQAEEAVKSAKEELEEEMKKEMKGYETTLSKEEKTFSEKTFDTVQKFTDLSERMRIRLNELGKDMAQIKVDQDELKLRGVSTHNRTISLILLAFGVLFVLADLILFVTNFGLVLTIDSMIIFIVIALIGVTMMFVATLV